MKKAHGKNGENVKKNSKTIKIMQIKQKDRRACKKIYTKYQKTY